MSCGERIKIERRKRLSHAYVLTAQAATLLNTTMAVVKMKHHCYGEYYETVTHEEARRDGLHVHRKCEPS